MKPYAIKPGTGPRRAREIVRAHIPHAEADRQFGADIQTALRLLRQEKRLRQIAP